MTQNDLAYARSLLIYEDAHVLAFDKPSGLAVQGGSGVTQSLEMLLAAFAKSNGKVPRLVHRLDRETSGVIVAARTKPAAAALSQSFAARDVDKTYVALVCGGRPNPPSGDIELPLMKTNRRGIDLMEVDDNGQAASTGYETRAANEVAALLHVHPESGRMHQIRAHLAAIGRPIAGDGKYGGFHSLRGVPVPRLMLHAERLSLPHPNGGALTLTAPPPDVFPNLVAALGLDLAALKLV